MSPVVVPAIAVIGLNLLLTLVVGVAILRRPWQRCVALGCALIEAGSIAVIALVALA